MSNEQANRIQNAVANLRPHIRSARELPDGYSLLFVDHPSPLLALVDLLSLEGLSCPSIRIELEDDGDGVWVHFTGGGCVKEFLKNELVGG